MIVGRATPLSAAEQRSSTAAAALALAAIAWLLLLGALAALAAGVLLDSRAARIPADPEPEG